MRAPDEGTLGRLLAGSLLIACLAIFLLRALELGFISDDAFISLRYARNLVDGHGLVFNPGERVEGFSNLLFVLLVAGCHGLGVDPLLAARALGLAAGLALVGAVFGLAYRLAVRHRWLYGTLAALVVASSPYSAAWAAAGLETTLYSLLVLSACALAARPEPARGFALASFVALLVALTRPEGIAVYPLVVAVALVADGGLRTTRVRRLVPGMALFTAGILLTVLWRQGYYGEWLPNTFFVRSAFSGSHLARGVSYLASFASNLAVAPLAALATVALLTPARRSRLPFALLAAALLAVILAVGGDGLPAYRFLVPVLGPLAVLASLGAHDLQARFAALRPRLGVAGPALLLVIAILLSTPRRDEQWLSYEYHKTAEIPSWTAVGRWLERAMPPETTLAAVPIGAVSYYSRQPMIDLMGLTDRHIARTPARQLGSGWAGHEKSDGAYVLGRAPEILLLGNIFVSREPTVDFARFPPYRNRFIFARERDIVEHPSFARDYRPVSFEIEPRVFLHCFVRRAWAESLSRPAEPLDAPEPPARGA